MITSYFMPTRIIAGEGLLRTLPEVVASLGGSRPFLFTDPTIALTPFATRALADLNGAGLSVNVSDTCGIDARLTHIYAEAQKIIASRSDCVIAIGGGSVMCTAKGAALAAANRVSIGSLRGKMRFSNNPLPMIMVPTTAGTGSEVSQWTVAKDDINHVKFAVGGPQNFPNVALLDPITLETLPKRIAALAGVDALTHAVEAYFTDAVSPISDSLALHSARMLFNSLRPSILAGTPAARLENMIASSMANMACTNAGLGLCHSLSAPLESNFDLPHALGVSALLPRVFAFNAERYEMRARETAEAFGIAKEGPISSVVDRTVDAIENLYGALGLPSQIDAAQIDSSRIGEMAKQSVNALSRGNNFDGPITDETYVISQNIRPATVREAIQLYHASIA